MIARLVRKLFFKLSLKLFLNIDHSECPQPLHTPPGPDKSFSLYVTVALGIFKVEQGILFSDNDVDRGDHFGSLQYKGEGFCEVGHLLTQSLSGKSLLHPVQVNLKVVRVLRLQIKVLSVYRLCVIYRFIQHVQTLEVEFVARFDLISSYHLNEVSVTLEMQI